jgi:RNA polymerase sigma-70 factor (ECF subfamily)
MGPSDPRSDTELLAAFEAGEAGAFDALYFRHRDWVARLARRWVGNDADALDVLQDTFGYVLSKIPGLRLTAAMRTFLYPVVRNLSLATLRKRRTREATGDLELVPDRPAAAAGCPEDLQQALAGLSDDHRETLLLRFVDGLSLEEIAAAMAVPLGTVKSRIHHAINMLRQSPHARRYFLDQR